MTMTNQEEFAARLARVKGGGAHTNATIFVGADEQHVMQRAQVTPPSRGADMARNALYPLSLAGAFALGLLAAGLGYLVRYQIAAEMAIFEDGSDIEMMVMGGIGMAVAFALAQIFRLRSKEHLSLQGIGVAVMVCGFHNFAHWLPGPMAVLISPQWVEEVQLATPANSARFRGVYFPLIETAADSAATPDCTVETGTVSVLTLDSEAGGTKGGAKMLSVAGADSAGCE